MELDLTPVEDTTDAMEIMEVVETPDPVEAPMEIVESETPVETVEEVIAD